MPEIPKEYIAGVGNILKPAKMGLSVGDRIEFTITKPHVVGGQNLISIPVSSTRGAGNFPLNKTHAAMLVETLGDDSDKWVGAKFTAAVVPQNNPQTKSQVLSWAIIRETISKPKSTKS